MHKLHPHGPSHHRRGRALIAGLLLLSSSAGFAQSGAGSGGGSQAERDLEAARRAADSNATATPEPASPARANAGGAAGTGAIGTGAAGTGTSGTGAGGARPGSDAMERARERNMPGATPGDAPERRIDSNSGRAPGTIDMEPPVGGAAASQPGAGLGGLPSDGVAGGTGASSGANGTARDSRTTARMIGETSFAYRDRAMTMAERELSAGNSLSSSILRGSVNLSGAARTRVDDSVARANAARTELSKAISRARSANEERWEPSRAEVVNRYEDYVKALEEARTAATEGGVRLPDAAGTSATTPAPR